MNSFSFCISERIFVLPLFLEHFAGYRTLVEFSLHVLSCCSSVFCWLCLLWEVCQRPHVPPHACPQHIFSADCQSLRARGRPRQCTLPVSVSFAVCVVSGFASVDWSLSLHFQTFLYLVVFCCMPDIVTSPLWVLGIFVFLSIVWFFFFLKCLFLAVLSLCCCVWTSSGRAPVSHCSGFFCCRARARTCGLSSCGSQPQFPAACGIFCTRDWTSIPCLGTWVLNRWATQKALNYILSFILKYS